MTLNINPPPIIHTRIPASLQQVFIKSNRGQVVHVPPHSSDVSICRNWHDISSSKRRNRKKGASIQICCDDKSTDDSLRKVTSFELPDDTVDSTTVSDISESECGWSDDDDSSIDSVDLDFLEKVVRMEIAPSSRWEPGDRDACPQKQLVRKKSLPNIDMAFTLNGNRWVDGVQNVSTAKHRLPPRTRSPLPCHRSKMTS